MISIFHSVGYRLEKVIYEENPVCSARIKRAGSVGVVNGLRFEGPFIIPGTRAWPPSKLFALAKGRGQRRGLARKGVCKSVRGKKRTPRDEKGEEEMTGLKRNRLGQFEEVCKGWGRVKGGPRHPGIISAS
ncbi:uncharacterized protein LOC114882855 isoform X2 [Osmia bicornis bicornis]|uniref:uncharacterized protein LOC114882855 isoform X2 n=1 Tax=Osmia bicornis bicornis TaxID=1437191 RepID=UPI001EAECC4C|nr:uncharacterized protein LOC114882855 isoform X2 [Osmia bicornis bicornis]